MIYYSGEAGSARLSADGGESFLASLKGKFLAVQLGGSFSSAGVPKTWRPTQGISVHRGLALSMH